MGAALVVLLVALGALAAGVLIGRYYVPDDRMLRRSARHAKSYLRALSHQIARDSDTVIAELRRVVDDNVEDSEPYFALGALFRSKGEHERAIRVHQALAVREAQSGKLRLRALYELGLDFRAAGMPKRAGKALEEVLVADPRHEGALRALCGLYEEQGRFAEAAAAWERLGRLRDEPLPKRHHHLLCAAAQRAIADGDADSAKRLLKDARGKGGETPHFLVAAGELAAARGDARTARSRLAQALTAAPELVTYLAPALASADRQLADASKGDGKRDDASKRDDTRDDAVRGDGTRAGDAATVVVKGQLSSGDPADDGLGDTLGVTAAAASLAELATTTGSPHLALAAALAAEGKDPLAAVKALQAVAADAPTYLPARIAAARIALAGDDAATLAGELRALIGALGWADGTGWRCTGCGHRLTAFTWRCPSCRRWASFSPEVGKHRVTTVVVAPRERRSEPRRPLPATGIASASPATAAALPSGASALARVALDPDAVVRSSDDAAAVSGALALPAPTIAHGLTSAELSRRAARPSVLGRVGGWFSSTFRRGRR